MPGPLDGVRIVEIIQFQQGPVAGMRLGDLGADVVFETTINTRNQLPGRYAHP
ncbi:CoA transferase [Chloroflexota bacterium]